MKELPYLDVNECLNNNGGCSEEAKCSNTFGSRTCKCNQGYQGNGVTCDGEIMYCYCVYNILTSNVKSISHTLSFLLLGA